MSDFDKAFVHTMSAEGGYVNDPQDAGGETYMGVARNRNSKWDGWVTIDLLKQKSGFPKNLDSDENLQQQVKALYEANYWDTVQADSINDQDVANSIFDFAVNAGVRTSSRLAQLAAGAESDGVIGKKSIEAINSKDPAMFLATFALAKIERYIEICKKRPTNRKYFFGWVRRTLEAAQ